MEYNTSELCDIYQDMVDVLEPMLCSFGGRASFGGVITTVKCFESNGLIREVVKENGVGRVLLIDGGGSMRRALIDSEIATTAAENEWEGIVCYGCVREVDILEDLDIGIQALAAIPVGADHKDVGETDLPVNFGGVTFLPDHHLYADTTGVILSPMRSTLNEPTQTEDGSLGSHFLWLQLAEKRQKKRASKQLAP